MSTASDGLALHLQSLSGSAGVEITYSRDADSVTLTATPGETVFDALDQGGNVIQIISQDFIVARSDLVLSGAAVVPARNDKIVQTVNGAEIEYRLLIDFGLPHFREMDAYGKGFRLHTKRIE